MYINYFRVCNLLQIQGGRMGSTLGREATWTVESESPSPETFTYKEMFLAVFQEDLPSPAPCQEQKPSLTRMWVMLHAEPPFESHTQPSSSSCQTYNPTHLFSNTQALINSSILSPFPFLIPAKCPHMATQSSSEEKNSKSTEFLSPKWI